MEINIVIKGWYTPPSYPNRFKINWPHRFLPNRGDYIDVRPFLKERIDEYDQVYVVSMVQWDIGIYVVLTPIK